MFKIIQDGLSKLNQLYMDFKIKSRPQVDIKKVWLGSKYGGYWVSPKINNNSIVYSLGIGTDVTFDLELINKFKCNLYAFDPTIQTGSYLKSIVLPDKFHFHQLAISDNNGMLNFYPPVDATHVSHSLTPHIGTRMESVQVEVKSLTNVMSSLNHDKIHILKMDVEGAEYKIINDIIEKNINIYQICLEFHHRFSSFSYKDTVKSINLLNQNGYLLFARKDDSFSFIHNSCL